MRRLGLFLFLFIGFNAFSQDATPSPVKWGFELKKSKDDKVEFVASAKIEKGWNIYSVYMGQDGPIPTEFVFDKIENGSLEGKIVEHSTPIKVHDEMFDMEVIKFKEMAKFSQTIASKNGLKLQGEVLFMCCDSKRCLPPTTEKFNLSL